MTRSKRFDYVRYDKDAIEKSERIKSMFEALEQEINLSLPDSRPKSLCITELEKAYMWIGKALRDETLKRNPAINNLPERG